MKVKKEVAALKKARRKNRWKCLSLVALMITSTVVVIMIDYFPDLTTPLINTIITVVGAVGMVMPAAWIAKCLEKTLDQTSRIEVLLHTLRKPKQSCRDLFLDIENN